MVSDNASDPEGEQILASPQHLQSENRNAAIDDKLTLSRDVITPRSAQLQRPVSAVRVYLIR